MRERNIAIGILVGIVVLLVAGLLWAALAGRGTFGGYGPGMMGNWGYPIMMGGGIMMFLMGLPVLVGVGAFVWWIASAAQRGASGPSSGETPLETLKRRYARGEISREEYEQMRREIE